ncbi:MAG: prefoldin subunit [Candidatus Aenigmatarchaeota archaeon]
MKMAEKTEEIQFYQQQLQNILIQKESLKLQNLEIESALEELKKSKEKDAYKIVGNVMIKKDLNNLIKELEEKKEEIEVRIKSLEKTEERVVEKIKELQGG